MKIGILTQPLKNNYGGLLQAYALKEVLSSLGHEVLIINRQNKKRYKIRIPLSIIKSLITGRRIYPNLNISAQNIKAISEYTVKFREKYIPNLTHSIAKNKEMYVLNKMGFEAYIVGSDQCWRPIYSPKISNYFLDFAQHDKNIKRIAYAASFGVSNWEFNRLDAKKCADLARKFDAISVREDTGVTLVNKYFGMDAVHLLDPTMLLTKEHYIEIVKNENISKSEGNFKSYILDDNSEKDNFIASIEYEMGLKHFKVLPKKNISLKKIRNIEDFVVPSPAKWIRGFQDAKFVVTDSFHGTVFSILFNIPFISIGNKGRGMTRFESLLRVFGLEDRLITSFVDLDVKSLVNAQIDWSKINKKIEREREKSISFLTANL